MSWKVISLIQPWASLWVSGVKIHETRSWPTQFRGRLYVQASFGVSKLARDIWFMATQLVPGFNYSFEEMPRGMIIGSVFIESCHAITQEYKCQQSNLDIQFGDWSVVLSGRPRFAFKASDPQVFATLIRCPSQLGIFDFDPNAPIEQPKKKRKLPAFVIEQIRERKRRIKLEKSGMLTPADLEDLFKPKPKIITPDSPSFLERVPRKFDL